jgi:hypothetical protein
MFDYNLNIINNLCGHMQGFKEKHAHELFTEFHA